VETLDPKAAATAKDFARDAWLYDVYQHLIQGIAGEISFVRNCWIHA
jgi:hypothetical protein